ncbi:MAG: molybdopterin-dependent oxidoreductase [Carbonactinosporaceae bacterium]
MSDEQGPRPRPPDVRRRYAPVAGLVAAAVGVGVGELIAALVRPLASPVVAVGGAVVELVPTSVERWAISVFGTADKPVLVGGVLLVVGAAAVVAGVLATRRLAAGLAMVMAFGAAGAVAALTRSGGGASDAGPAISGALAGGITLWLLVRAIPQAREADAGEPGGPRDQDTMETRRRFVLAALGGAGVAVLTAAVGRGLLGDRVDVSAARSALRIPPPDDLIPGLRQGAQLDVRGLGPFYTPNRTFYRIDTALVVPQVDPKTWTLRVHGMVDREIRLTLGELLRRSLLERDITLSCVSNEVGGDLVGTARWVGVSLADLLREAGVHSGADQLVSRSADGMTIGTPVDVVMDGRDALLAVQMNGVPLPAEHGFPVRMLVPGLYGYVSATKWVVDLELTTFEAYDAYWVERGWAARAPVKTTSRIDVPGSFARLKAGRVTVAGVTWAREPGIKFVQVRVDRGSWRRARVSTPMSRYAWRQWMYLWDAAPGEHTLQVRAVDRLERIQTGQTAEPFPDGATGWHTISVTVEA